ncbi:LbtU family siderophore porin [Candidatus Neptunichlamydia sp. REUL1]|uniref:LbtU family siderophore porin n=1 Tax=Candidatus Neptunichlamydia sp. REUL1 TaxID=3064277 RepID=UPI00292EE9F0|nr:LbtU family siderophore porin [Candidatus Neptunochlamydia sp. REUL1]
MKLSIFILAFLAFPLLAVQEGIYIQFQEAEQESQKQDPIEDSYQNLLLKRIEAPSEEKEMTLQQRIANYFGTFVTSSPYPGVRATFEGTELMASLSNVNKDLQILLELAESTKYMQEKGIPFPINPRIFLSGEIEFTGFVQKDARGRAQSDLDITDAEVDFLIVVAPWLYGFIGLEYDNSVDSALSSSRIASSRFHADSLFITFGDFSKESWYGTLGQTYVPYGQYTTYAAVHNPLTRVLFRTLARDITLGFFNDTVQFAAFVFKGDSHADSGNNINNYGVNLGFHFNVKKLDCKLAVGAVRNIADSTGMQEAFGDPSNTEKLRHIVPGLNANGNFSIGDWTLLCEYNQTLRPFNPNDAAFSTNGTSFKGAKPIAFDTELAYAFKIAAMPSSLALGYSRSYEALAFNVPKERITLTWATYVFRGNLLSVELNSDKLYDKKNRAAGNVVTGLPYFINPRNLGHRDYTLSIDYLLYF